MIARTRLPSPFMTATTSFTTRPTTIVTALITAPTSPSMSLLPSQTTIEPVDEIRHPLQPFGDHPDPVLEEVLRLDDQRLRQLRDHVVGRDRPAAVDDVVQIAGREACLGR